MRAELGRGGRFETITIDMRVELKLQALTPDFNGDGVVNFADFLLFGRQFGARQGDGRYEAKYDLDSDGAIGFGDFLIFGSSFGKDVSTPGGGGGGGTGSPDLIVNSPSVSDSTLTTGQLFTLRATVRNQGSGQSAATTLHYYQSGDAIISSSDTRVGSEAVGSLNASSSSIESINLNAPSSLGTYYYGACISSVSGESNTENNCSRGVRVTVRSGGSTTNVDIPDENLRAAIETALGKASGAPITRAEMASLTRLEAPDSDISDLTGLEFATNLSRLDLGEKYVAGAGYVNSNNISNLAPLANLTTLTTLDLDGNFAFSDVSPLANLNNLRTLRLSNNFITDIPPISGLTNLTSLSLSSNTISDVSALANLTSLERLWLHNNIISDVSALSGMARIESLGLYNNTISDLSPLSGLTNLTWLNIYNNVISDVSALSGLTRLETLGLSKNLISDVSALSGMTQLEWLNLSSNLISDVSVLSDMARLTTLYLYDNTISDIAPLVANTGLGSGDEVDVRNNPLSAISLNTHIPTLQARGVDVRFGASKPGVEEIEQGLIHEEWEERTPSLQSGSRLKIMPR